MKWESVGCKVQGSRKPGAGWECDGVRTTGPAPPPVCLQVSQVHLSLGLRNRV